MEQEAMYNQNTGAGKNAPPDFSEMALFLAKSYGQMLKFCHCYDHMCGLFLWNGIFADSSAVCAGKGSQRNFGRQLLIPDKYLFRR